MLRLGIPKGSLQEHTIRIFRLAGFDLQIMERSYRADMGDPSVSLFLLRAQEIPRYVSEGKLDAGICGDDWIAETRADVEEICDLKYAKKEIKPIQWVLAVPENSDINSVKNLAGKKIASEAVNITEDYLKRKGIVAQVEFSWGATEVKAPHFADAIVDLMETGTSLKAHNLKILDVIFESSTKLVANKKSWEDPSKKSRIGALALLLSSAAESELALGLMMHVHEDKVDKMLETMSSLKNPSITRIPDTPWFDVFITVKRKDARQAMLNAHKLGCEGIVEFSLDKMAL